MDEKKPAPEKPQPGSARSSCLMRGLIGCGCLTFVGVAVLVVGAIAAAMWGIDRVNELAAPFERDGYRRVTVQVVEESRPVPSKTVYTAQAVILREGSEADLALICQVAEVHGTVNGDIDFFGQVLEIERDAVVTGDIRVQGAQVVEIRGEVAGEISGTYGVLDDHRR